MAAAGGSGFVEPSHGSGDGAQLRLVSGHAGLDDDVDVLHLPLRILAHSAGRAILSGSRESLGSAGRLLHRLPPPGRSICIRHPFSGLLSNHLAFAARTRFTTRRHRRLATCRCPDPHLQRAARCRALHRARRAQHGLAGRKAARLYPRRWPSQGV